ncbi:serine hydrolase [bacterium]|nr:MAG: serine hydrolase [bacterium]
MKTTRLSLLFSLILLLGLNQLTHAQLSSSQVDSLMNHALKTFNVAGAAVAIVKDGKIIHEKGYGVRSVDTKAPVNEHTNFEIASNSKAFTSASIALLVEEGKLKWTDKVVQHIPEFKMYDAYTTANFTIADLLSHRSGMGLGAGDLMWWPNGSDFTIQDMLSAFQHFKPESDFRTQYAYNNILFFIAGEVIHRVSGKPWEEFVQERILTPLEMDQSYTSLNAVKDRSNLSAAHKIVEGKQVAFENYEDMVNGAAAQMKANVHDLSKWMLMHLNKGKYGENLKKQLFSEKSQQEMWRLQTVINGAPNEKYGTHFYGYGLGWAIRDVKGYKRVSHSGGLPGMLTLTVMIPDINLGFVILTNTHDGGAYLFNAVSNAIIDSYVDVEASDWIDFYNKRMVKSEHHADSVVTEVWKTVKKAKSKNSKPEDFIGMYEDAWFGKAEVFMNNGKLWLKALRAPNLNGQLYFYNANTFAVKWEYQHMNGDVFALFTLDENGKAQGFMLKGISPNIDFSYDFQDLSFKRVE